MSSISVPLHAPYLLPQNRKLRHLRGIYVRNLTFPRPRAYSIDDVAINKSPEKRDALRSGAAVALQHSQSSNNLKSAAGQSRRRRSTLSGADALARQHIFEQALDSTTADAFFSLHVESISDPFYVSEVREKATNFNFRFFDLTDLDPFISRSTQLVVRFWVRRTASDTTDSSPLGGWILLVHDTIDLRFLGCINNIANIHFPPNAIVFHLLDGIYMAGIRSPATPAGPKKQAPHLPTSSYNALMRLTNLENSIQDCFTTQDRLTIQIDDHLANEIPSELPDAEVQERRATKALARQRRVNEVARRKRSDIALSIQARRTAIAAGRLLHRRALEDVEHATEKLAASRATATKTLDDIRGQRRRICEDLIRIFSIVPVPSGEPLSFQICGLPLPNTEYGSGLTNSSMGEDALSAALGYVALLANALQVYLNVALPYRVTAYGSRSVIRDDISKIPDQQREFPLYIPRGGLSSQYRFDYAWFLLNKNIETLCNSQGLRVVDIRHTLPNLKYLLYVCSAGSEELPERKRGGVRGLWQGHRQRQSGSTVTVSIADDAPNPNSTVTMAQTASDRQNSVELPFSFSNKVSRDSSRGNTQGDHNGSMPEYKNSTTSKGLNTSPASSINLPFDESTLTWTLRTKGMRENIDR